ncbi:11167_t:CDS:1, partial [Ambispora gerdemannii]
MTVIDPKIFLDIEENQLPLSSSDPDFEEDNSPFDNMPMSPALLKNMFTQILTRTSRGKRG